MSEQNKSLVEELKKRLYKRGTFKEDVSRSRFSLPHEDVGTDWSKQEEPMSKGILNPSFLKKFFIFALAFFLLTLGASAYIIWSGSNVVSADNLEVLLKGPTSIKGGDELNLGIVIANNNSTKLEFVDLIVSFPIGTREAGNLEKEITRYRKNLGTLEKGAVVNESVKAVLFGEAGKDQEITVALEYRTVGSNAIFEKQKKYTVVLSASPLDVNLSIPQEVNSGNQIEFTIDISAEAATTLSNILVQAEYPAGFQFREATPKPFFGNNLWRVGDLRGETIRKIRVTGTLDGQDAEKKLFKVTAGTAATNKEGTIGVPYGSTFATVLMRRSFVDLTATLNGQSHNEVVVDPGLTLRGDISWTNNLPDKLLNAQVTVKFLGNALDQTRVSAGKGSYRSVDDTIVWSRQHAEELALLEPGTTGSVNFDFNALPVSNLNAAGIRNPYVEVQVTFQATRVIEGSPGELVETTFKKMVRVNSYLDLTGRALYTSSPFVNNGPMPPRANEETTYTMVWSLVNTSNDLDGAVVRGTLPSHARFLGTVSPVSADVRHDATTGQVTWNVGRVESNVSLNPVREVAFQIALLPSVPQVGQTIPLMTNMGVDARDLFTGTRLTDGLSLIDTRIATDPNFQETWAKVSQ